MCPGERHRESVVQNIAVNLESWTVQTKQETAIYHTLNQLSVDTSRKVCYTHTSKLITLGAYPACTPRTCKQSPCIQSFWTCSERTWAVFSNLH